MYVKIYVVSIYKSRNKDQLKDSFSYYFYNDIYVFVTCNCL